MLGDTFMEYTHVVHEFEPIYNEDSKVLILGSFPSVKSRANQFYYGHPQNRFWKVTAGVCGEEIPTTIEEKRAFLLRNHIAVWDVIESCDIVGSSDSSIKNVVANDMDVILTKANIRAIYAMMMPIFVLVARMRRQTSKPSMPGSIMSSSATLVSGCSFS